MLQTGESPVVVRAARGFLVPTTCGLKRRAMNKHSKQRLEVNRSRQGWTVKALVLVHVCYGIAAVLKAATPMFDRLLGG